MAVVRCYFQWHQLSMLLSNTITSGQSLRCLVKATACWKCKLHFPLREGTYVLNHDKFLEMFTYVSQHISTLAGRVPYLSPCPSWHPEHQFLQDSPTDEHTCRGPSLCIRTNHIAFKSSPCVIQTVLVANQSTFILCWQSIVAIKHSQTHQYSWHQPEVLYPFGMGNQAVINWLMPYSLSSYMDSCVVYITGPKTITSSVVSRLAKKAT